MPPEPISAYIMALDRVTSAVCEFDVNQVGAGNQALEGVGGLKPL